MRAALWAAWPVRALVSEAQRSMRGGVVRAWSVSLRVLGVQRVAGTRVCGGSSGDVGLVCVYLCSHAVCWWWCCLCWWWQCVVVWWVGAEVRGRVV